MILHFNDVSKSGMGDIYNKYSGDSVHSINMKWHLMLDESKDVSYQFNFHTGNEMKDFFITCEKLDNNYRKSPASQQFNYFTCNERPGEGYISMSRGNGGDEFQNSFYDS